MKETTDQTKIAVLEANMANIAKDISDIKEDVKAIIVQLNRQPSLEQEIIQLKDEIRSVKNSNNLWKWLAPTLTSILSAAVTFLLIKYIEAL